MHPRRFGFLVFCARIVAGPAGLYPLANFECSGRSDVRSCVWTAFIGRLMAAWAAHLQQDKSLPLSLTGRAWAAHFAFSHGRARARYGKANFHGVLLVRHTFELMDFVLGFPEASLVFSLACVAVLSPDRARVFILENIFHILTTVLCVFSFQLS